MLKTVSTTKTDVYLRPLPDWQRSNFAYFRDAVHGVAPDVEEGWKWDVPVFLINGRLVCSFAAFAKHTKYNFFSGAAINDPTELFNSGLESKRSRSINLAEGESLDARQLDGLLGQAFAAERSATGNARR